VYSVAWWTAWRTAWWTGMVDSMVDRSGTYNIGLENLMVFTNKKRLGDMMALRCFACKIMQPSYHTDVFYRKKLLIKLAL
jgi:hypothetical protein